MNNKSTLRRPLMVALSIANLCVLTFYVSGRTSTRSQEPELPGDERLVTRGFGPKGEPLEFSDVKVKGKSVRLNKKFEGEGEWLKELNLSLRNKSDKAITFAALHVDFPETKTLGGAMVMHPVYVGQDPSNNPSPARPPLRLGPGESVEISLAADFELIKRSVETYRPVDQIREVVIRLDRVMFEDGTLYSGGGLFKRNPDKSSPRKWVLVSDYPPPAQH